MPGGDKPGEMLANLSVDCIILGFYNGQLKVLLLRWKDTQYWSLPGGPVFKSEDIDDAASRVLKERTCLEQIFLRQFHTFGSANRYDLAQLKEKLKHLIDPELWYERAVTVGYYALVEYSKVASCPDHFTAECRWWDIHKVPELLFDHNQIIERALQALRIELNLQPVGYSLLPEKFTLPELQKLYETILDKPLDPRNFQRKIKGLGILDQLKERKKGGAHKAPYLYRFNREAYEARLQEGGLLFL